MPLFQHVKAQRDAGVDFRYGPAAVILAPTRELALQILEDVNKFGFVLVFASLWSFVS
jgi:superfamily II DNA/RNA helicase